MGLGSLQIVIYNYLRLRWYKRSTLETFFQFLLVFLFFPGFVLFSLHTLCSISIALLLQNLDFALLIRTYLTEQLVKFVTPKQTFKIVANILDTRHIHKVKLRLWSMEVIG